MIFTLILSHWPCSTEVFYCCRNAELYIKVQYLSQVFYLFFFFNYLFLLIRYFCIVHIVCGKSDPYLHLHFQRNVFFFLFLISYFTQGPFETLPSVEKVLKSTLIIIIIPVSYSYCLLNSLEVLIFKLLSDSSSMYTLVVRFKAQ